MVKPQNNSNEPVKLTKAGGPNKEAAPGGHNDLVSLEKIFVNRNDSEQYLMESISPLKSSYFSAIDHVPKA